ncbi:phosphoenolpyruvate--protein phosphotransferase [Desulfosarcina sp. OttesenSCG-928-A07]|nr:phosphoenolpyruvate--protein phosphotransferase [Desulfosarcina sp. OttesenSCG-928-A07]
MTAPRQNLLNMLCNLGDLSRLAINSQNIEDFLQGVVSLISDHLNIPVCSIYLYDDSTDEFVLRATVVSPPDTVMADASDTGAEKDLRIPDSPYFSEAADSFGGSSLTVPINRGVDKIGKLVVQHTVPDFFDSAVFMALNAISAQLAAALESARVVMGLQQLCENPETLPVSPVTISGDPTSGGYAMGLSAVWGKSHVRFITDPELPEHGTLTDFHQAIQKTTEQLDALQKRCAERLPENASLIFSAHFMILKDPEFVDRMAEKIRSGTPATRAVQNVAQHYIHRFNNSPSSYIREKVNDIEDLSGRLLGNLMPPDHDVGDMDSHGRVVIAHTLYPSELLKLGAESVAGIVLVDGCVTSHAAIIARSLKIPMVMAKRPDLINLEEGTVILVDGDSGNIHVAPPASLVDDFKARARSRQSCGEGPVFGSGTSTVTLDGTDITLYANINLLTELPLAEKVGADGIGLYRTEFPFLMRPSFPSETEQYLIYRQVSASMTGKPVIFRTLDIGGEKTVTYANTEAEANPELGLRSIRFTLKHRDIFEQQIRAILRAAADNEMLGIMFPLISSIDDFRRAKQVVQSCLDRLQREKLKYHHRPFVGMMIELPAVVETMPEYAAECDFFSIGTNDFVQYMLAVDRSNKQVADYYRHEHPSVLRALSRIVRIAADHDKPICICGEMAHDKAMIPFLLGIGLRRLSIDPQFIPAVRDTITRLTLDDCQTYAQDLLTTGSIVSVQAVFQQYATLFR